MTHLKGVLYQSGNLDFPRSLNEWAFARMQNLRSDQEKRIVMKPEVAPIELTRSPELDETETDWLDPVAEMINACDTVNLQRRESTLRLRKAICDISDNRKLVILVSQEAIDEFANQHWKRIAYFYAHRQDGFRFNLIKMISMRAGAAARDKTMELTTRVGRVEGETIPSIIFDATGSTAAVEIVEWRGSVKEGASGRFKNDETEVRIVVPQARRPLIFLYERRPEFKNHAYLFSGDELNNEIRRVLKKAAQNKKAAQERLEAEESE